MRIDQTVEVPAPITKVWDFLGDIPSVATCMPGATLTKTVDDSTYEGLVKIGIGPLTMNYTGTVTIEERDEAEHTVRLLAVGRDRRGSGTAKARITARLLPAGDGTRLRVDSDVSLTGRVAALGRGVNDVAASLFAEFADRLTKELSDTPAAASAPPARRARTGAATGRDAARRGPRDQARRPRLVGDAPAAERVLDPARREGAAVTERSEGTSGTARPVTPPAKEGAVTDLFLNPYAGPLEDEPSAAERPLDVHRRLPGYAPTPLTGCPDVAADVGLGEVWVKDESSRLGLPSFKILGASYATYRALAERLGGIDQDWQDIDDLRNLVAPLRPLTLVAATDGNHGRAVARMARLLGFGAAIYVPAGTAPTRMAAIESEGATVEVVDGDYDAAIRRSAEDAGPHHMVISDTSWEGYVRVPAWVIDGYTTIFEEVAETGRESDLVVIPVGVGALAAATIQRFGPGPARILGVEPASAACVQASLRAGEPVTVPGPHPSIMAGLNCGTPSLIAWPRLRRGLDAVVAISDDRARDAMRTLAAEGIVSGETGAAALGGLYAVLTGPEGPRIRELWGLDEDSRVLVLSTEGATDPDAYDEIVGRAHPDAEELNDAR